MAIFTESALRGIIKHKTNANDFTENIPITHSSAVVVDNEAEEFLDTRLISLNNDIDENKTNITSLDDQLNGPRLLASGETPDGPITVLDAEYSNIAMSNGGSSLYMYDSTGVVMTPINFGEDHINIANKCLKLSGRIGKVVAVATNNYILIVNFDGWRVMGQYTFGVYADTITSLDMYDPAVPNTIARITDAPDIVATAVLGTTTGKVGIGTIPIDLSSIADPYDVSTITNTRTPFGSTNVAIISSLLTATQALFLSDNGYVLYDYLDGDFVGEGTTGVINNLVGGALMPDEKSAVIGDITGNVYKFDMTLATVTSTYSSGRKPTGSTLIGIDTDNVGNIYIMYSNGTLRKLDSSFNLIWDYNTTGTPTSFTVDKHNGIGVICYSNNTFNIVRVDNDTVFTAFTAIAADVENQLMPSIDYIKDGSAIRRISVCQLFGDVNLTGDVTGTVTLIGDNTCRLTDMTSMGHTEHAISISATLSPDATISKSISSSDDVYQVANKEYVDYKTTVMRGATTSIAGRAGLVPAPTTTDTAKFLRGDGTWVVPTDTVYTHPTVSVNSTTNTAAPTHGGTFTVIDGLTTNSTGHVTALNTKTITLPTYSTFTTSANGLVPSSGSNTSQYLRGDGTWATPTDTVYTHPSYTTSKTTSTATATHGGTFTVIDSLTTNSTGHVTALNTKTITLPPDNNTDEKVKMVATEANYKTTIRKFPLLLAPNNVTDGTSNESYYVPGITLEIDDQFATYTINGSISGRASSASRLSTGATGSLTQPVYFSDGVPVATTYSLNATVPSDAVFTDTTYSTFTTSTAGLVPAGGAGTTRFLRQDGTWVTPNDTVVTYNNFTGATSTEGGEPGLVPAPVAGDQLKFLRADATWVVPYTHPTYTSRSSDMYKITVDTGGHVSAATKVTKADITALGIPAQDTTYSVATTSTSGLMSSADKTKLDAVPTPSTIATKTDIDNAFAANDAMTYKGVIEPFFINDMNGSSTNGEQKFTPAANAGDTYKIAYDGYINGIAVDAGDMLICTVDNTPAATLNTYTTVQESWNVIQSNIDGAVTGPESSTDNAVAIFNGTNGKTIKNSGFTIGTSVPASAVFTDTVYTHPSYTASSTTSTASPSHGGTFTVIDSLTTNSTGHVTALNTKTITLPADNNTDTKVTNTLATTTRAYITGTTTATTNTGTQVFDSGVYLGTTAGELVATTFTGNATSASTASKLSTGTTGSATRPVYFSNGIPVATTYSLNATVPSNAVFTDTVYTHPTYTTKTSDMYKITVDDTGHVSAATKVTKADITALGIPAQDTTYNTATTSTNGLMSSTDKTKLDAVPTPSTIATTTSVAELLDTDNVLRYKGTIQPFGGLSVYEPIARDGDVKFTPAASAGDMYIMSEDGLINGVSVHSGDAIICITDNTPEATSDTYTTVQESWNVIQGVIYDAVSGPSSSINNTVAIFDGTTGKTIKNSAFTIGSSVPDNAVFTDEKVQMNSYDDTNLQIKEFPVMLAPSDVTDGTNNTSQYVPEITVRVNHGLQEYGINADLYGNAATSHQWLNGINLTLKDKNTNSLGSVAIDGSANVDLTMNMIYSETEPTEPTQGMIWFKPLAAEPDNNTSAYIVSSTEPTDTGKLWVDTSNSNILKFYDGTTWTHVGSAYS